MKRLSAPTPVYQGFEFGIRPGIENSAFILCKVAFSFGFIEGKGKTATG